MSIVVIYGGTRENGNTEYLTEYAIKGVKVDRIYLKNYDVKPIVDQRHDEEGFHEVHDDYDELIKKVLQHDTLIFATPIYWYSMSGMMKNFVDRWSQTLRDVQYPNFRERMKVKNMYVITVGGDNPSIKALPMIQQFQYICDFFGMTFEKYIIGQGSRPADIKIDERAILNAEQLRKELKEKE